ncbi:MAG: hypothetical protein ACKPKO_56300, partial [Candidatus Fonsibacter sp.]
PSPELMQTFAEANVFGQFAPAAILQSDQTEEVQLNATGQSHFSVCWGDEEDAEQTTLGCLRFAGAHPAPPMMPPS